MPTELDLKLDSLYVCTLDSKLDNGHQVDLSVIMPIFNQQEVLRHNLNRLASSLRSKWELILIDDSSTDGSLQVAQDWASEAHPQYDSLCRVRVLKTKHQVFETLCDAIGISETTGPYVLEVQSDMEILEPGFDEKLLRAIKSHPDLLMISGRGCHPLDEVAQSFQLELKKAKNGFFLSRLVAKEVLGFGNAVIRRVLLFIAGLLSKTTSPVDGNSQAHKLSSSEEDEALFPSLENFSLGGRAGRLGMLLEKGFRSEDLGRNQMWVSETVMRGPLLIHKEKYIKAGGFDSRGFFLGNDDHDLAHRAFISNGYRTAFVPVGFSSPLNLGSTRKKRSLPTLILFSRAQKRTAKHIFDSGLYQLTQVGASAPRPVREIRTFDY
jgi:glycosyltransferase involved in cell wall biosynthesis